MLGSGMAADQNSREKLVHLGHTLDGLQREHRTRVLDAHRDTAMVGSDQHPCINHQPVHLHPVERVVEL